MFEGNVIPLHAGANVMRLLAAFFLFALATPGVAQNSPQVEGAGPERKLTAKHTLAAPVESLDLRITRIMAEHDIPGVALVSMKGRHQGRVLRNG